MQKSMWLLAFLPYLHGFGSVVDGAVVLTSPSNLTTPLVRPSGLNGGIVTRLSVIDKERGPELPAAELFKTGIVLMGFLAPEDFDGFMPSQAWSLGGLILGVSVDEEQGVVERAVVMEGLYFIFLLMKQEKDFRSGVFEIQYSGIPLCDLVIFSTVSSGLHLAPDFAHVTQLHPPPSPIADNTNSFWQLDAPVLGMMLNATIIMPFLIRPMDELGELISLVDMLVTIAQPPGNERVQKNIESIVPSSGVKISLSLTQEDLPNAFTYADLIWAVGKISRANDDIGAEGQALRGQMYLYNVYQGEVTLVPSNSSPSTIPLIEASVNASTGTATARKRWSMA